MMYPFHLVSVQSHYVSVSDYEFDGVLNKCLLMF